MTDVQSVDHRQLSRDRTAYQMHDYPARMHAISVYAQTLSIRAASKSTGIPESTINGWLQDEESDSYIETLRSAMRAELAHTYVEIARKSAEQILDRLENGDEQVGKDGELIRVKVKARDLAAVNASAVDRHALLTGMSQGSKAGAALAQVAANLIAALNQKQGKLIEGEPVESRADQSGESAG
jgi:hypothetical protein